MSNNAYQTETGTRNHWNLADRHTCSWEHVSCRFHHSHKDSVHTDWLLHLVRYIQQHNHYYCKHKNGSATSIGSICNITTSVVYLMSTQSFWYLIKLNPITKPTLLSTSFSFVSNSTVASVICNTNAILTWKITHNWDMKGEGVYMQKLTHCYSTLHDIREVI